MQLGRNVFLLLVLCMSSAGVTQPRGIVQVADVGDEPEWVIAIHGGAGDTLRSEVSAEQDAGMRAALVESLQAGAAVLSAGGVGIDAIEAALTVLEDSPLFNAGRGAVLDEHGNARHDASIMRGEDRAAGAIAGSSRIRNPISAAKAVMEQTQNVLLSGDGADWFASEQGLEIVDPIWFETEARRRSLQKNREQSDGPTASSEFTKSSESYYGTVGAVVLDTHGNIAAGTTTGGRTNKRFGRIGDTPIIGAGTYAANESCAVSATGHGEYFMRWTVARDICARVEYKEETLEDAARFVVLDTLMPKQGYGAVITLDPKANVVFVTSTAHLKRGVMSSKSDARVAVFSDEEMR